MPRVPAASSNWRKEQFDTANKVVASITSSVQAKQEPTGAAIARSPQSRVFRVTATSCFVK
jgi:hypothetical protein